MHITLRFIGEVDEITAEEIDGALSRLTASPLNIALSGAGRFNSWNKPRAVWVGVEKTPDLMALQEKVDRAIINIGLPPEGRKYMPHVTLARLKTRAPNIPRTGSRPMARFARRHLSHGKSSCMRAGWVGQGPTTVPLLSIH
tara:strand:+ start:362 stop:787 length:426 start_codon:yes stop_codon:yes gene_type:complete